VIDDDYMNINSLIESLKNEAAIHRQLRHPNIVSLLGVVFETNHYGLIFESVTYGSWINFMRKVTENDSSKKSVIYSKWQK